MQKKLKLYLSLVAGVLLILVDSYSANAANPVVHVSAKPTWLSTCKLYSQRPSARNIENGYFYALIEQQIQVEKQADYHHVIKEIVSETGIQNAS